ncbi:MAG: tetratricopeptide repeat protein [Deltaproteobacteria bacterium]|nr:tetratricopeptide repeat protein [Deltaproteobacteria bacterium]
MEDIGLVLARNRSIHTIILSLLLFYLVVAPSFVRAAQDDEDSVEESTQEDTGEEKPVKSPDKPAKAIENSKKETVVTPEALEEYKEVKKLQEDYENVVKEYRDDIFQMVEHTRARREREINRSYDSAIDNLEKTEELMRNDAIAKFEKFLEKYPDDPHYSPDAMYRLAELYFRSAQDKYLSALDVYDEEYTKYEQGVIASEPAEPTKDFSKSIALYQDLIGSFPHYRFADGALYLLGYCLKQQGENKEAKESWDRLVKSYPKSRFVPEALTRIGEYYFDSNELESAIATYRRAKKFKDSPWYDKILYKLGWTYYRLDRFQEAVTTFGELLDLYEKMSKKELAERGDLKKEAIEYTAVSFSEPEWGGQTFTELEAQGGGLDLEKNIERTREFFKKQFPNRKWERDVWKKFAEVLYKKTRYREAIIAYKKALALNPLAKDAPLLQEQIINAYTERREMDKRAEEMERLVKDYSEGSPWWKANENDPDTLRKARRTTQEKLLGAAVFHHETAQKLAASPEPENQAKAFEEYKKAATGYAEYLKRFPHDERAYELTYYLGDALYFSKQYEKAAKVFAKVRDSRFSDKYRVDAAKSVLFCVREIIKAQEASGKLAKMKAHKDPSELPKEPLDIPPIRMELVKAGDKFLEYEPQHKDAAVIGYNAALVFYRFGHFDEAERRLKLLINRYPKSKYAMDSIKLLIDRYIAAKNYEMVAKWATKLTELASVGGEGDRTKDAEEGKALFVGARFNVAMKWMKEGKYEKAANEFLRIVDENPKYEKADVGINNAAVCFTKAKRYITSMKTYERLVRDYPKSGLAANATWYIATNAEQGFDFNKAITYYEKLVEKYPTHEHRADAAYNAALLREKNGDYKGAAKGYERYARMFPDRDDAASVFFQAGRVYEKAHDIRNMTRVFKTFIKKYGKAPQNYRYVMEALVKIGDYYYEKSKKARNWRVARDTLKTAKKFYSDAVDFFDSHKLPPGNIEAEFAAKAAFLLAEFRLPEFEKIKISGGRNKRKFQKVLKAQMTKKMEKIKELRVLYENVLKYSRADWFLAAKYRLGYLPQAFAKAIMDAPAPPDVARDEEAMSVYQEMLYQAAEPIEEKAIESYKLVVETSERFNYTNEWVTKAKLAMAKLRPSEYKIDKPPKMELIWKDALYTSLVGQEKKTPPSDKSLGGEEKGNKAENNKNIDNTKKNDTGAEDQEEEPAESEDKVGGEK